MERVELGLLVWTGRPRTEVDVCRAVSRQRRDAKLSEDVDAIRGLGSADLLKVFGREVGELAVAEVLLVARMGQCEHVRDSPWMSSGEETYGGGKILLLVLVVHVSKLDELALELLFDLLENLDGLLLGRVHLGKVNCVRGGHVVCEWEFPVLMSWS